MKYLPFTLPIALISLMSGCATMEESQDGFPDTGRGPTWYQDVAPIVTRSCTGCHRSDGPAFSFERYEQAAPFAALMAEAVADRRMPPWGAQETDRCQPLLPWKDDARLSDAEIALIAAWAGAGAPEGDPASPAPLPEARVRTLEDYDQLLFPRVGYAPSGETDEYICFSLDPQLEQTRWLTGLEVDPGNRAVVHHMDVIVDPNAESVSAAGTLGYYNCAGGNGLNAPQLVTLWSPGMSAMEVPAGAGIEVKAGSRIVMSIHYHPEPEGPSGIDVSALKIRWVDAPPQRTATVLLAGNADSEARGLLPGPNDSSDVPEFRIPADVAGHTEAMELTNKTTTSYTIWAMGSHMHYLGSSMMTRLRKSGAAESDCLLDTPRWDFDWQMMYAYDGGLEALPTFAPGDTLIMECAYDNTLGAPGVQRLLAETGGDAPYDVYAGATTHDEMCLAFVAVIYEP